MALQTFMQYSEQANLHIDSTEQRGIQFIQLKQYLIFAGEEF